MIYSNDVVMIGGGIPGLITTFKGLEKFRVYFCSITLAIETDFIGLAAFLRAYRYIFDTRIKNINDKIY